MGAGQELDDAIGPRSRGLSPAARADPVGGLVPGQHVWDAGDAAVWAADHGGGRGIVRGRGRRAGGRGR